MLFITTKEFGAFRLRREPNFGHRRSAQYLLTGSADILASPFLLPDHLLSCHFSLLSPEDTVASHNSYLWRALCQLLTSKPPSSLHNSVRPPREARGGSQHALDRAHPRSHCTQCSWGQFVRVSSEFSLHARSLGITRSSLIRSLPTRNVPGDDSVEYPSSLLAAFSSKTGRFFFETGAHPFPRRRYVLILFAWA